MNFCLKKNHTNHNGTNKFDERKKVGKGTAQITANVYNEQFIIKKEYPYNYLSVLFKHILRLISCIRAAHESIKIN